MTQVTATEVSKLRKATGAGMMDCKNALVEAGGDFKKAIEIIRKKGQAIANKRADREATEGVVLAKISADGKNGVIIVLNCETDFVAKTQDFYLLAESILNLALEKKPSDLEDLKNMSLGHMTVGEAVVEKMGIIGEKIDLSYFGKLVDEYVVSYIHPGNKLATLVAFHKQIADPQAGKDIAMQVAAMNPISVDKEDVPEDVIAQEIEIGKEQARREGKAEDLLEKIALGKLNKFYKESTLMNQEFIKDNKQTIAQYFNSVAKDNKIKGFLRYSLRD